LKEPQIIIDSIEKAIDDDVSLNWEYASTYEDRNEPSIQNLYRSNKSLPLASTIMVRDDIQKLDEYIFNAVTGATSEYADHHNLGGLFDEGYFVLKYEKGTEYKQHFDCGGAHKNRVLSMIAFLNDDFEGGKLEFPTLGITYEPSAGDVVFFPSCYSFPHIVHPVSEGVRYSLVTWLSYE
jgi:predicted 2-oxoglutarate/Fe(II)-dependent dioxygenase YbiX